MDISMVCIQKKVFLAHLFILFGKDFIYLFLDRGEGREKERERKVNVWLPLACPLLGTQPAIQACVLTGNRTCDPVVHRLALNPLRHTSQGPPFPSYIEMQSRTHGEASVSRDQKSPFCV